MEQFGKAVAAVDVSSFLVLEASGDSEFDSNPAHMAHDGYYEDDDDDDAESCSWDLSESSCVSDLHLHECDVIVGYDDDDDLEDDHGYADEFSEKEHKSAVSVDSCNEEHLDETDKNRLFWEACLAS